MIPELVTVGHILNENIEFPDRRIGPVLGSPAAYSAVAAGMLGVKTGIVTKIGEDMPGELLKPLTEAWVDTRGIKVTGPDSTTNLLIYDEKGNKTLKYLKKAPQIFFKDFPEDYLKAKAIHICPLDNEIPIESIKELRDLGLMLSTDLGGFGGAHSGGRLTVVKGDRGEALKDLVKNFNVTRASSEDCQYLLGARKSEGEYIAHLFVKWGADIGVVTLGKEGSIVVTRDETFRVPVFPVRTVDPTGAGDTYSAGFIVEYIKTKDPKKSAIFASATASFVVERPGDGIDIKRFATIPEVQERIQKFSLS